MTLRIVQNEIQCRLCNSIIYSAHRHDYRSCRCGAVAVDGGMDYLRRVGDPENIIERAFYLDETVITNITAAVTWGKDNNRNDYGIALAVFRALRNHNLLKDTIEEAETAALKAKWEAIIQRANDELEGN